MDIDVTTEGDIRIAVLRGEFDLYSAEEIKKELRGLISDGVRKLLINMNDVTYIDSSGVGALIRVFHDMRTEKGKIHLVAVSQAVRNVLQLSNMLPLFGLYNTHEEAVNALQGS
jgi:anti-sigma B factor antagonist